MNEAGSYTCEVTSGCGMVETSVATVALQSRPVVNITGLPSRNVSIKAGSRLLLAVATNRDDRTTFQWFRDGQSVTNDSVSNDIYIREQATAANAAGRYWCVVTNRCGSTVSDTITVVIQPTTSVSSDEAAGVTLYDNQPNPFFGETSIRFGLATSMSVRLVVSDMFGREIAVLANGQYGSGDDHVVTFNASNYGLSSGVYYYTLFANGAKVSKNMMFVR
jgi:hypothetical protein